MVRLPKGREEPMRVLNLLIGVLFLTGIANIETAKAGLLTWTFVETSCVGSCQHFGDGYTFGKALAQLALSDGINSSGTYSYTNFPIITSKETGDPFSFEWFNLGALKGGVMPVPFGSFCSGSPCDLSLTFSSSATAGLSIDINTSAVVSTHINLGSAGGEIDSDGRMPGCGDFAACRITGVWNLSVPEPSSLSVFVIALMIIALVIGVDGKIRALGRSQMKPASRPSTEASGRQPIG